ncbi:hypothetical protein AAE478_001196 [Parahypoxylon ruwenzoriense]
MTPRQLQLPQFSESNGPSKTMATQSQHFAPRKESTLAYDSLRGRQDTVPLDFMPYQRIGRQSTHVPELESYDENSVKRRSKSHALSRWLGKRTASTAKKYERPYISEPRLISAPRALGLPDRSPVGQMPKFSYRSQALSQPEALRPQRTEPSFAANHGVRRQNLGTVHDALGSHPVSNWLNKTEKRFPAQQILFRTASDYDHEPTICSKADGSRLPPTEPEVIEYIRSERRKGRIFSEGEFSEALYEFPDPEDWCGQDDGGNDYDQYWEDAGFHEYETEDGNDDNTNDGHGMATVEYDPKTKDSNIPKLEITHTGPDKNAALAEPPKRVSKGLLSVDDCYERLWSAQLKETMGLRQLIPLAQRIAEVGRINSNGHINFYKETLESLIRDHDRLYDLMPVADLLAEDQNLDISDLGPFTQAFERVLAERDTARSAAGHHKRQARRLEGRIAELESEMNMYSHDDEEYVRLRGYS